MERVNNQLLIEVNQLTDVGKLVQIFELVAYKLDLKTISNYAKENNISYNGAKNCRNHIKIDNVKFVCNKIKQNNLPF